MTQSPKSERLFPANHRLIVLTILLITISACQPRIPRRETITSSTNTPQSETEIAPRMTATPANSPRSELTTTPKADIEPDSTQDIGHEPLDGTWVKLYGGPLENLGGDVIQALDGGLFMVGGIGRMLDDERTAGVLLIRTDETGKLLWERVFGGQEFDIGWSILQTRDGDLIIAGETTSFGAGGMDAYLIKVNQQGDEIWSRTFGSPLDEAISTVQETSDGEFFLIGNQVDPGDFITDPSAAGYGGFAGRSNIHVIKTDANGDEIWSRTFESQDNIIASSGVATPEGGLVILATIIHFPSFDNDIYLLKIDKNGDELWSRTWDEDAYAGYDIIGTLDDGFLITGIFETGDNPVWNLYLLKVDSNGNELWRNHFGDSEIYRVGCGIIETKDGHFLLLASATNSPYSGQSGILLAKVKDNGAILWEKTIDILYSSKPNAILQHLDGGYVITGASSNRGGTPNAFLLKTDQDGNVTEGIETVRFP